MRNRLHSQFRARITGFALVGLLSGLIGWSSCGRPAAVPAFEVAAGLPERSASLTAAQAAFLDTLQERAFRFFWERSDPRTGMTPDRWPTESFVSVGAVGFALTAYPIGIERGWITRNEGVERVTNTLRFFWEAPQDSAASGSTGYRGFFYHFLDPRTGHRFEQVELSTVDTALFLAGALFCQSYFDRPEEAEIGRLADQLYARVDWRWAQVRPPVIALGWSPEEGHLPYDWRGYNEAMILQLLALGSPSHAVGRESWNAWLEGYRWDSFEGQEGVQFSPLFGHQYSHIWIDFRGIQDDYMRSRGIDYFENSRRATYAQQAYAIRNPSGFRGYGRWEWGLTACDGPLDATLQIDGQEREFHTYWGRGVSALHIADDGTICPSGAGGSIVFAPEIVVPTLIEMRRKYGTPLFGKYGFLDAYNPTLDIPVKTHHGQVIPEVGWFDTDYLGIDQGPFVAMIENHRSELVWKTLRRNPHIVRGLRAAGFGGGWLDEVGP